MCQEIVTAISPLHETCAIGLPVPRIEETLFFVVPLLYYRVAISACETANGTRRSLLKILSLSRSRTVMKKE